MSVALIALVYTLAPVFFVASLFVSLFRYIFQETRVKALDQKHVVITGCDSGFGQMASISLAQLGLNVYSGCLTKQGIEYLEDESSRGSFKGSIRAFKLDVTKDEDIVAAKQLIQDLIPQDEGVWALINNAGIMLRTFMPDSWLTIKDYQNEMDVNFFGQVRMVHQFLPLLKKSKGRIINTCSIAGFTTAEGWAPYAASKFAAVSYVKSLRVELAQWGVSVISISPGVHPTNLTARDLLWNRFLQRWESLPESQKAEYEPDFMQKKEKEIKIIVGNACKHNKPENVVKAYVHAVTAAYPHLNYWVGWDAKWVTRLMTHLTDDSAVWYNGILKMLLGVGQEPELYD